MPDSPYEHFCMQRQKQIDRHLNNPALLEIQRRQLRGFLKDFCQERKHAVPTQESYVRSLAFYGLWLKKNYRNATKANLEGYLKAISQKNEGVQIWARTAIKVFYRWLISGKVGKNDPFPPVVRWMKMGTQKLKPIRPEDLPSEAEIKKLLGGCRNLRDTAYIKMLLDTGGRAGELLNSRIKHLHLESDQPYIEFPISKTVPRPVPLIDSLFDLRAWLEMHPQKSSKDFREAFIFVPIKRNVGKAYMLPNDCLANLKHIARRAGIERRIWNHLFRHISSSFDSSIGTSQPVAHAKYGWSERSNMWLRYSHPSVKDIANFAMRARGMPIDKNTPRAAKQCPRCRASNPWDREYCGTCGQPLGEKALYGHQEMRTQLAESKRREKEMLDRITSVELQLAGKRTARSPRKS